MDKIAIVAIGASTGGPRALENIFLKLPENLPAAYMIVQHMPPKFTTSFAARLDRVSELNAREAFDREIIKRGHVYVAPGDYHMIVKSHEKKGLLIRLTQEPLESGHRPSINTMMKSIAQTRAKNVIGVIMTGMGEDGSEGIKKMKQANNAYIIAQDEKSSIVYGMPEKAMRTGAVDVVLTLEDISGEIIRKIRGLKI
jgi:two-component system, chemotaxis family, protein-glutamate methylesterase/glutaminase